MHRLDEADLLRQPSEVFEVICKLGKGSYGSVYKARHKDNGMIVAVKKVPVDTDLSDIVKEISIMQQCDSPFIVQYFGSYFDNQDLWICMEYCGAGSVSDIMRLRGETLEEEAIAAVLHQSLLGLEYLHQLRKIHRDIKAGNILLNNQGQAKLADFGVAGQLSDTLAKRNTVIGTPYWMAPEVIQEVGYDCSADIWSLGITAIEMADGKPPYGDIHPMRALFMIPSHPPPSLKRPDKWSDQFVSFVTDCLVKSPEARPSSADLLEHIFIRSAKPPSILQPIIDIANEARELRLQQKGSRDRVDSSSSSASSSMVSRTGDVPEERGGEDMEDGTCGTMIRKDTADSALSAAVGQQRRDTSGTGTSSLDSELGTMVINSTDEEEEDEDGGTLTTPKYRPAFMDMLNHTKDAPQDAPLDPDAPPLSNEEKERKEKAEQRAFAPLSRAFQEGQYESLSRLSADELERRLSSLKTDLEAELRNLEIRYEHKRQPILDAINDKLARQPQMQKAN